MTADTSRHFADAHKRYRALVHQQGRLPTDAEANHAEEMDAWQGEAQFREVIAELGSPDQGFRIVPNEDDADTFDVLQGAMYADGARLFNPADLEYASQASSNWLTMGEDDAIAAGARVFVWLEAETRIVTGVEDSELIDPAYRGADGAARSRICWRVKQKTSSLTDCQEALEAAIGSDTYAMYERELGVVSSTGTLKVDFSSEGTDLDLCKPTASGGYFGDRNATYRVKITDEGRLIWGEDNASALYRVQIAPGSDTITFLTHPRDEWQRPKAGQVVELLRGDVQLENLEKIAERDGTLMRVVGSYANGSITVMTGDVPEEWDTWLQALEPELFADSDQRHLYLRVWSGGHEDGERDWGYTSGDPFALGETGLSVTIDGSVLKGDSWSFSARPDAPQKVIPWDMHHGMTPHSPRRFYIPLGFINLADGSVHDCRLRFRSLQRIQSCCTVTVGDGVVSRGDTDSILEAMDLLPETGGEICLLKGNHVANVPLTGKSNICFSGCKGRATWSPADPARANLTLTDCSDIRIDGIHFIAGDVPAIAASANDPYDESVLVGNLTIADCAFAAPSGLAVAAVGQNGFRLIGSTIKAGPYADAPDNVEHNRHAAVQIQGTRLLVERCYIDATIGSANATERALGGIHVLGDSIGVAIRHCTINEGSGSGIVLGSVEFEDVAGGEILPEVVVTDPTGESASLNRAMGFGFIQKEREGGGLAIKILSGTGETDDTGTITEIAVSAGELHQVLIEGNTIHGMDGNGVATYPLGLFNDDPDSTADAIAVDTLDVTGNRITECRRSTPDFGAIQEFERIFIPVGGIALSIASNGLFRENHIEGCGLVDGEATCGIGVSYGEALRFEDNVIIGNGRQKRGVTPIGPNAAISVRFATGGLPTAFVDQSAGVRAPDRPAISVQNNLLDAPSGRAIRSLAQGPVRVSDNRLVGANPSRALLNGLGAVTAVIEQYGDIPREKRAYALLDSVFDVLGGDCVNITNIGLAEDFFSMLVTYFDDGLALDEEGQPKKPPQPEKQGCNRSLVGGFVNATINSVLDFATGGFLSGGGEILFTNNQVSLRKSSGTVKVMDPTNLTTGSSAMSGRYGISKDPAFNGLANGAAAGPTEDDLLAADDDGPAANRTTEAFMDVTQAGVGSISSIFLASLDDIHFGQNQCEIESERYFSFVHAILFSLTLRTQGNRMQEGSLIWRSIAGYGLRMHAASFNQTTACSYFGPTDRASTRRANNVSVFKVPGV